MNPLAGERKDVQLFLFSTMRNVPTMSDIKVSWKAT